MGRTVSYSVVKRNNPLDQDAVPKFYAHVQVQWPCRDSRNGGSYSENLYGDADVCRLCLLPWRM